MKSLQPGARPSLSVQGLHRGQTQRHAASPATPVAHWGREPKPPAHRAAVCHSSSGRHALTVMAQSLRHIKTLLAGRTVQDTHGPSQERPAAGPEDFGMCRVWRNPSRTMPARGRARGVLSPAPLPSPDPHERTGEPPTSRRRGSARVRPACPVGRALFMLNSVPCFLY